MGILLVFEGLVVVFSFFSNTERLLCDNQPHAVKLSGVYAAAFRSIDPGGVHAAVSQNVRQPGQIPFQRVVRPGK